LDLLSRKVALIVWVYKVFHLDAIEAVEPSIECDVAKEQSRAALR
jgi:hypothetical protein